MKGRNVQVIEAKNQTLLNQLFSQALNRVCSIVWGSETDEKLFKLLDAVSGRQNDLQRLYKKYAADPATFEENWEPFVEGTSPLPGYTEKISLSLTGDKQLSAMERYHLRDLLDIKG